MEDRGLKMPNVTNTTTTNLDSSNLDYQTPHATTDESPSEYYWNNDYWSEGLGIFKNIAEYKEPTKALARWSVGRGYVTDAETQASLKGIRGSGEGSFQSIMNNHIIVKKTNGEAFTEIIRDGRILLNFKQLTPSNIRVVYNPKGMIIRYEEINKGKKARTILPKDMLHSINDKIAGERHGTPSWEACKWELEAKKEAMEDWRRISHRSTIRVMYVDMDNTGKISTIREQYKEGIKKGEVLILPVKKGDAELEDLTLPPIDAFIRWIEYLDRRIYQSLGIPKAIADTSDFTEAASKVGYMTFEPVYVEEQTLLEQDLLSQVGIEIKFNRPPSLSGTMQEDEAKNTGQTSIQPNETQVSAGRTE